ncbi:MAG: YfiR family protein [Verrucomicrobiales bacterium]|nr:YfiR family protein [Verrucomicrobiales bacterium]
MALYPGTALARNADKYSLTAALTLRIAKFITWPDRPSIPADRPFFIVGVMGSAHAQNAFAKFQGVLIKGLKFKTVSIDPSLAPHDIRRCHIVFSDSSTSSRIIDQMIGKSKGILTVHGPGSPTNPSACLKLTTTSGKIAFDIDLDLTRRAALKIDVGIIKLARHVSR